MTGKDATGAYLSDLKEQQSRKFKGKNRELGNWERNMYF